MWLLSDEGWFQIWVDNDNSMTNAGTQDRRRSATTHLSKLGSNGEC